MSFDILKEFDTLYSQKPAQSQPPQAHSSSSSSFSFFDELSSKPASNNHGGGSFVPPQRPSSVRYASTNSFRGNVTEGIGIARPPGSGADDLLGLFDGVGSTTPTGKKGSPMGNLKQLGQIQRPVSFDGFGGFGGGGGPTKKADPFSNLSGLSGGLSSNLGGASSYKTHNWNSSPAVAANGGFSTTPAPTPFSTSFSPSRSTTSLDVPIDDFGDFTSASMGSSPDKISCITGTGIGIGLTIPSKALQDNVNSSRKSPLLEGTPPLLTSQRNNNGGWFGSNGGSVEDLGGGAGAGGGGDDFGEFIVSPVKDKFPGNQLKGTSTQTQTQTHISLSTRSIQKPTPSSSKSIPNPILSSSSSAATTLIISTPTATPQPTPTTTLPLPPLTTLLAPFPTLLHPCTTFFTTLTTHPYPLRNRILSHPTTRTFLLSICEIARVSGRLIVGRNHKRKRGSNSGSSSGGITPAGKILRVTPAELKREEREVSELVRCWKEDVSGRMRSAGTTIVISTTSSGGKVMLSSKIPELEVDLKAEKVGSLSLGGGEGGEACLLCGLYKDEVVRRLREVVDVPSIMSEGKEEERRYSDKKEEGEVVDKEEILERWWVGGWGHRSCRAWWGVNGVGLRLEKRVKGG